MDSEQTPPLKKRRSGSEQRRSGRYVAFRMTPEDHAELTASAERAGVTVGAFIRGRVIASPKTRPRRRPSVEISALAKVLAELHRSGNNVNQIAKHLNFGEIIPPHEISEALREWRQSIAGVLAVMGHAKP